MSCRRRIGRRRGEKRLKAEGNVRGQDIPIYLCLLRVGRIEVSKKEGLMSRIGTSIRIGRGRRRAEEKDWEEQKEGSRRRSRIVEGEIKENKCEE